MSFFRLLNIQGLAGIAVSLALAMLLGIQKIQTHRWQKQSGQFEQLYRTERASLAATVANYRAAAETARAADQANANRVAAEQRGINERIEHDFEARIAAARAAAERLRIQSQAAADPGARGNTSMPSLPAPAWGSAQSAEQDRLPASDALTATEQAIQLDELIKWVKGQAKVDNNPTAVASPPGD